MTNKHEINSEKQQAYKDQAQAAHKLTRWIGSAVMTLLILLIVMTGFYVHHALQPVNRNDQKLIAVNIPIGATNQQIAAILHQKKIIRNAAIFNFWLKTQRSTNFQAGKFYLSPAMENTKVVKTLQGNGERPVAAHVLIREGDTIDTIASSVQIATHFTKKQFLALMKDQKFLKSLAKKYPALLGSTMKAKNVRYALEGYLFPARYDVYKFASLKELVTQMVAKSNQVLTPYFKTIKNQKLTVQEVLTLASLVEREGVKTSDRRKIAGVFFNRLSAGMPLQSDISVMYALNRHKHSLTIQDTKVKSPYNLYIHKGYGPGPFNNPSLNSIRAVLNPMSRDQNYLYFVADLKSGKVYYSHTYDEHLSRNRSLGQ